MALSIGNAGVYRPENVLFEGRLKVKERISRTQHGLKHGTIAARDASVLGASAALSGPGSALTTAAGLLATDGFQAGKANQMLVGMVNFSNMPETAQFIAQNHNAAMAGGALVGASSLYASKYPVGFLNQRAADLLAQSNANIASDPIKAKAGLPASEPALASASVPAPAPAAVVTTAEPNAVSVPVMVTEKQPEPPIASTAPTPSAKPSLLRRWWPFGALGQKTQAKPETAPATPQPAFTQPNPAPTQAIEPDKGTADKEVVTEAPTLEKPILPAVVATAEPVETPELPEAKSKATS